MDSNEWMNYVCGLTVRVLRVLLQVPGQMISLESSRVFRVKKEKTLFPSINLEAKSVRFLGMVRFSKKLEIFGDLRESPGIARVGSDVARGTARDIWRRGFGPDACKS